MSKSQFKKFCKAQRVNKAKRGEAARKEETVEQMGVKDQRIRIIGEEKIMKDQKIADLKVELSVMKEKIVEFETTKTALLQKQQALEDINKSLLDKIQNTNLKGKDPEKEGSEKDADGGAETAQQTSDASNCIEDQPMKVEESAGVRNQETDTVPQTTAYQEQFKSILLLFLWHCLRTRPPGT